MRRRTVGWTGATGLVLVAAAIVLLAVTRPDAIFGTPPSTGHAALPAGGDLVAIHSPGRVTDDRSLAAGGCQARVLDGGAGDVLPDPGCTPGAIDPAVTQANIQDTICVRGYTAAVRPPRAETGRVKHAALVAYGMAYSRTIELDHLVPLSLGGANAVSNLWPEPNAANATGPQNAKDDVELALSRAVCEGRVPLATAQRAIAADWTVALRVVGVG